MTSVVVLGLEPVRDSLASAGERRYVATTITADSLVFGPLVGVRNFIRYNPAALPARQALIMATRNGARALGRSRPA